MHTPRGVVSTLTCLASPGVDQPDFGQTTTAVLAIRDRQYLMRADSGDGASCLMAGGTRYPMKMGCSSASAAGAHFSSSS
jgi:hypothetical protein